MINTNKSANSSVVIGWCVCACVCIMSTYFCMPLVFHISFFDE